NFTPPIGDEPYDVGIANLEKKDNLYLPFQGCAGVEGTLVLATPDSGVAWVTGDFKMRAFPMWTGADGEHLYEGRLTFKVRYDATGIYAKKGYGKGTTEEEFGFWAVRSLQENMLEEPDAAQLTERLRLAVELNTSAIQDEENSKPQKAPKPPIPDPQHCSSFTEAFEDMPYDIGIAGLRKVDMLAIPGQANKKVGVEGALELLERHCGVSSSSGNFQMHTVPIWTSGQGDAIYEGYVKFNVLYSGLYARKGFGFWAIRSKAENALEEGNVTYLAKRVGANHWRVPSSFRMNDYDLGYDDEDERRLDSYLQKAQIHSMGSARYKHWFKYYGRPEMSYDTYESDDDLFLD
ncbi:hypothetical protein H0H92_002470, partial [Tricholoma furcatifolium]